jgi:hypothetical protein
MRKLRSFTGLVVLVASFVWAPPARADIVADWNAQLVLYVTVGNATLTPPIPVGRPGPPGLLDIALAHVAIHDAVQAIEGKFKPYYYSDPSKLGIGSSAAAVAAAAHRMLVLLYPGQQSRLDAFYDAYLTSNGIDKLNPGIAVGEAAAMAVHAKHYRPTNTPFTPFFGNPVIGQWRSAQPMAFQILNVTPPFTLKSPSQFRPQPPPPMTSTQYYREHNEVMEKGRASAHPNSMTDLARFWAGNYVLQWNEVLQQIAVNKGLSVGDSARLFALANLAGADAAIAVWESKVFYNFWRPDTAIQQGDLDPNPRTPGDVTWTPLLASPPYPDYVSGANGLTAAFSGMIREYFGTDHITFSVKNLNQAVMTKERFFTRVSTAQQEVVDARILLGIHFRAADEEARRLGNRVANWVLQKFLRPVPPRKPAGDK